LDEDALGDKIDALMGPVRDTYPSYARTCRHMRLQAAFASK
jgi:hypothetical protein